MKIIELIQEALVTAGVIGVGYPPTDSQSTSAFRALIGLTDTMNADPLKKLTNFRFTFPLVASKRAYTIGADSSLDINAPRPQSILRASVLDSTSGPNPPYTPIRILSADEYAMTAVRDSPQAFPSALWYDASYSPVPAPADPQPDYAPIAGYGTINLIDAPTASNVVEAWAAAPLSQASSLFDDLVFPPAYYEYLLYGTTIRLYPRYTRPADPTVASLFQAAQLALESANAKPASVMPLDSGLPNSRGLYWDGRLNRYVGPGVG